MVDGLHEAIIDPDIFQQAADKIARRGPSPITRGGTLKNAFSGIAVCEKCGLNALKSIGSLLPKMPELSWPGFILL